ncbi:MAG: hypothetical protein DMG56_26995 [Acidobacteria bacterium]|nr:MAG: hypothetical protein DMG56_26995 [Acidobacteriota bacterium]
MRFISQPRRHPASTGNSHLRRGQQLVSHGGAAHPEHQRIGRGFEGKRFSEAHWPFAHPRCEGLQRRRGGQRSRQTRTGWHPQSERGGHRQSGAKQNLSRRLRCAALRGHRRLGTIFLLRSALPELFSTQGQSEATHGRARRSLEQYYHRYVVALLLGPVIDVVLRIEPVLNEEALRDIDPEHEGHEGELTAGRRLIDSLHQTYGGFIDAIVGDALYANGPVMTQLDDYGYSGFLVLKKEKNEPLKDALTLWEIEGRCESCDDTDRKEHVEFWDVDDIETLDTYKGKIRALRAVVTKPEEEEDPATWCFALIGQRARQLSRPTALRIIRSRWHIENTAFHQWTRYWNLRHVFRHYSASPTITG